MTKPCPLNKASEFQGLSLRNTVEWVCNNVPFYRRQVKKRNRFARSVVDVAQRLSRHELFDYLKRAVNVLVTRRIRDSDVPLAELAER